MTNNDNNQSTTRKWFSITTQYRENYGAHDWDGTGECPQYWKNKGGETFHVFADSQGHATRKFTHIRENVQGYKDSEYSVEEIIDVRLGHGDPHAKTQEEIDCTTEEGYCFDEVNREMLGLDCEVPVDTTNHDSDNFNEFRMTNTQIMQEWTIDQRDLEG